MPDETTINSGDSSSQAQELVPTVDISPVTVDHSPAEAPISEAQKTEEVTKETETVKEEAKPEPKGEDFRFDKHPRFKELHQRVKAQEEEIRKLREAATKQPEPPKEKPYKDWSGMDEDELLDWQAKDPKGFLENQMKAAQYMAAQEFEVYKQQLSQQTEQQQKDSMLAETYEKYASKNPDFDEMWDSGEIMEYMTKHPGHNAISAHQELTIDKRIEAAKDEAAKKALAEYEAKLKTKRAASTVMSSGPANVPTSAEHADDRLKNPNKYGGKMTVLAERFAERQRRP
jgi:hypothetical protein